MLVSYSIRKTIFPRRVLEKRRKWQCIHASVHTLCTSDCQPQRTILRCTRRFSVVVLNKTEMQSCAPTQDHQYNEIQVQSLNAIDARTIEIVHGRGAKKIPQFSVTAPLRIPTTNYKTVQDSYSKSLIHNSLEGPRELSRTQRDGVALVAPDGTGVELGPWRTYPGIYED
jgi:hypothetical protein